MGNPIGILVVCGGNTCRSPMAKIILEQMLKSKGLDKQFKVDSAAYRGPDGTTAHANARQAIKELCGLDLLAGHVPKKLTKAMADEADLIVVMEDYMKTGLPANKIIVLGIADPFGGDKEKYKNCATEIQQSLQNNWSKIVGEAPLPQKTALQPPTASPKMTMADLMKKYGKKTSVTADWVYNQVLKIAENKEVNYGRGEHAKTVTRLMLV